MSSMMDLAGALGGGAPPPGQPPNLGDPSGLGGDTGGATDTGQEYSNSAEALDGAEEALHAYIQLEPDEADRAVAAQCLQKILGLKAKDQSDMQSLQGALQSNPGMAAGPQGG